MRFAVFVSSLIIALYPSLVFANLPAPTGVVLDTYQKKDGTWHAKLPSSYKGTLGKAGGLIKGVPRVAGHPVVVGGLVVGDMLMDWCKANKKKCREKVGEDVYCVIAGNCEDDDSNNNMTCSWRYGHPYYKDELFSKPNRTLEQYYNDTMASISKPTFKPDDWYGDMPEVEEKVMDRISDTNKPSIGYQTGFFKFGDSASGRVISTEAHITYRCGYYEKDDQAKQDDLLKALKKLHDSLEDDEIKNIVNNYYGDDIDIEKQCNGAYSCTTINEGDDNDTTNNTTNNDNDTTNNNTKNDNDTTNNKTKKEDEDTTNNTTKGKGDEDELECNDTDLSKAVCKIIDWLDDEAEDPDDQKAKIKDEDYDDDLDDDTINVSKGCPSNETISYSMMGFGASIELPYHSICKFAQMVNPYVTASGAIVSFYIITGNRQS